MKQPPCLCEMLEDVAMRQLLWIYCALECAEAGELPPCPRCGGRGKQASHECASCHGTGKAPEGDFDLGGGVCLDVPLNAVQMQQVRHSNFARKCITALRQASDLHREHGYDGEPVAFEIVVRRVPADMKESGR